MGPAGPSGPCIPGNPILPWRPGNPRSPCDAQTMKLMIQKDKDLCIKERTMLAMDVFKLQEKTYNEII